MEGLSHRDYGRIVFFTGAGMSAESGVPTYRGRGGIWDSYRWEEYACQRAFERDPDKVLKFHELRRKAVLACEPHAGHRVIAALQKARPGVRVVTQNIDGMHQRAGATDVIELHGSLWRVRCEEHGVRQDVGEAYRETRCPACGRHLRPDIVWFEDSLDRFTIEEAVRAIRAADLFISIGTSGVVWPAAGFPRFAKEGGALCVEINPEANEMSPLYDISIREPAGKALPRLFTDL